MKNFILSLLITFCINPGNTYGQSKIGTWSDYLPLNQGKTVVYGEGKIYLISSTGIFFVDVETNSLNVISAMNELGGAGITSAIYSELYHSLILGFEDGLVIIYKEGQIISITDIKEKSMSGSKSINNLFLDNSNLYLATAFGIVKVNLSKNEVLETYPVSSSIEILNFNDILISNNKVWALSSNGLYYADLNQTNLIDFNSWTKILSSESGENFYSFDQLNGKIIIAAKLSSEKNRLIIVDGNEILRKDLTSYYLVNLKIYDQNIYLIKKYAIDIYNQNMQLVQSINRYETGDNTIKQIHPRDILINNGTTYIADEIYGLVLYANNVFDTKWIFPSRPESIFCTDIDIANQTVGIATGKLVDYPVDIEPVFHLYKNNKWSSIDERKEGIINIHNCKSIKFLPGVDSVFYLASWGTGLFRYSNNKLVKIYNEETTDSIIRKYNDNPNWINTWISGLEFDKKGNLWMLNSMTSTPLLCKNEQDEWHTYNYPGLVNSAPGGGGGQYLLDMFIDSRGYKWITIRRNGLFVVDDNGTIDDSSDDIYKGTRETDDDTDPRNIGSISLKDENGDNIGTSVNAIAEDKNGYMWFGTESGIAVLYRSWAVFSDQYPEFSRILIPRNDGTDAADYLLDNIKVTAIAVDGANRKWIGTENNGLFLVSEDGTKTIHEFNVDNSPLLSNSITSIGIDEKTGEVFIGTGSGIVSFKGSATEGLRNYSNVYAYPNPVTSRFQGDIVIKGLISESNIKITDISGNIVYETISLGGQAIWNGKNLWGERVSTGVYIVYASTTDGAESEVTKILFVKGE